MGKSLRDRLHLSACHACGAGVRLAITAATSSQPRTAVSSPCYNASDSYSCSLLPRSTGRGCATGRPTASLRCVLKQHDR
jgi:hypothetical protein